MNLVLMKQLCLLRPWTLDCEVYYIFKFLYDSAKFKSSCFFIHSGRGKGFGKLGLRKTFPHFNEVPKCAGSFYYSVVFMFVLPVPSPHSEQLGFSLRRCLILICSVAGSGAALQSLDFFSSERLCSCCACLDERLVFEFFGKYPCSLSPGQDDGLVYTGTGQGISKHLCEPILRVRAGCVMPASCTGGKRTCCSIVNSVLEPHLSFSFVLHFSGMKPHCHYLKVHAQ